jgi:dihydrofolate reductase
VHGHVEPALERMRQAAGHKRIWIVGGGQLASQFAEAGLLDEVDISVIPAVLGTGVPAFTTALTEPLTLTHAQALTDGSVRLRYTTNHDGRAAKSHQPH